ncbi:MAG: GIY-YIG nuclease family protein [Thermodesulfobacteriota bacterium]
MRSWVDGKVDTGYTTNLRNRFREHQSGEVVSMKLRRPFEWIFCEGYRSIGNGKRREKYLKTSKGKSSLLMMLRDSLK